MWLFGCLSGAEVFNRVSKYIQELYFLLILSNAYLLVNAALFSGRSPRMRTPEEKAKDKFNSFKSII